MYACTHEVLLQVETSIVQSIVNEGGYDAFSRVPHVPYWHDIHHMLRELVVDEVPLLREERVLDTEAVCSRARRGYGGGLWGSWGALVSLAQRLPFEELDRR